MPFLRAIGSLRLLNTTVIAFDGPVLFQNGSAVIGAERFRVASDGKRQQSASTSITMFNTFMDNHSVQNE